MEENGKLMIRTYASDMLIPISETRISIMDAENKDVLLAFRLTDENGKTEEIEIKTPDKSLSLDENNQKRPFSVVDVIAQKDGYDISVIENVQIFADNLSVQNIEMLVLPENAAYDDFYKVYRVTPQNL